MLTKNGTSQKVITIIIADDHKWIRQGLIKELEETLPNRFNVLAEANNGLEAYELSRKLNPDVLILDITYATGPNGDKVIAQLRKDGWQGKILAMSGDEFVIATKRIPIGPSGADAFLDKGDSTKIGEVLLDLVSGSVEALGKDLITTDTAFNDNKPNSDNLPSKEVLVQRLSRLTKRELQVFIGAANGQSSALIAKELDISPRTVNSHLTAIYSKLEMPSSRFILWRINTTYNINEVALESYMSANDD